MTSAEELLARLKSAGSIDELLRQAMRPELTAVLDRCAWVRTFDAEVFDVLLEGGPDVALEEVVASPDVREVSGRDGVYRVRRKAREAAFARLAPGGEVPPALRELSRRLAEYFRRRGRPRDELDQLIVAEPAAAITLLRKLYTEADQLFDLQACQALLDLVHDRGSLGGWELVAEQNRLERYVVARTLWRERYRQASRFLSPRGTEAAFERLLDEDTPNRLQLFADGGMGKTMHLYELIARRAVPEPRRLACALIDFDLTQLGNVLREPWLILPEIAHQLNQQLDEPLFDDFLKQYGGERDRLLLPQFAGEASVPGQLGDDNEEERERLRHVLRGEFFAVLAPPAVAGRVMIVFDTLEVITHVGGANAPGTSDAFVEELAALSRRLPAARIVMSGRYDLRAEIAGFEQRLGPVEHLELHRLDVGEARRYLRACRKLDAGDDVIDAAIAAASNDEGAKPLVLAMIADVIARDPAISADVVRQLDEPDLYYLMQRIVVRIPDVRVRWLLRYGVVPRLLSRRFVGDVIVPFLQQGIRGDTPDDDPARDRKPVGSPTADAFPVDTGADIDADDLWTQLRRYAAMYSWVEPVEPDVLRFHEEVVTPMRALLREQPVFVKLNRAASDYFERRAEEDPGDRARLLQEAFYHRLVLDVDGAIADWQRRTRDMATDPEGAAALADEVLDLAARQPDLLSREVVAQARVERAVANLRRATAPGAARGSRLWDLARGDVEQASCVPAADDARLAACRAALLVRDGAPRRALDVVAAQLARDLRPEDKLIMHVRRGDALALTGARDADADYLAAIALGRRTGLRDVDVATLHWKRATALAGRDDLDAARRACEQGLALAPEGTAAQAALYLLLGTLDLRVGTPSASAASAEIPLRREDRLRHEAYLLLASAELARWDPDRALLIAISAVSEAGSRRAETAEAGSQLAEAREIRARARAALGDERGAQEDLEAAALVWDSIASDGARRCFAEIAKLQMRRVGDLQLTAAALGRAQTVTAERAVKDLGAVRLRQAEYLAWGEIGGPGTGNPEALVAEVIEELRGANASPHLLARAALEGLCLPEREPAPEFLAALSHALEEIQPAAARLTMLEDLERCPPLAGLDPSELLRLRELLAGPELRSQVDDYPARDRRVALVRLADVARIAGDRAESWRLLETAHALPSDPRETPFARLQLARAAVRAGHTELAERLGVTELDDLPGLVAPPPAKAGELITSDRIRSVAKGVAAAAVVWSAWRLLKNPRAQQTSPGSQSSREPLAAYPGVLRPPARTEHPTLDIALFVDGDELAVLAWPPASDVPREARIGGDTPVVAAVVRATARPGPLDPQLVELFTRRAIAGPELAEVLLLGQRSGHLLGDAPVDVRLWTKVAPLAMVPWELAAGDGENMLLASDPRVRYLYRGFLDAEEELPVREPGPATVLVIRPQVRARREAPGMIRTTLVPVEDQYAAAGMRVVIAESVDLTSLTALVAGQPPDVVHIAAGFVDAGGGAAVDISSGVAGEVRLSGIDHDRLTATGLASALAAAAGSRPVIVLDPPAVSHVNVQAAQLLLRNAFATEVAAIAAVPAVIATGLVRYNCQDKLYRRLPRQLASGHPVAAVAAGIRALAGGTPDSADAFGFSPTALFAARPQHRIVTGL